MGRMLTLFANPDPGLDEGEGTTASELWDEATATFDEETATFGGPDDDD